MKRSSLVSIIIPTKNEQENVARCLKSCLFQTYKKIEIIVVDNFSQDKTVELAKKFTKNVYQRGPERSSQRNYGAKVSRGQYLLFVDCDMELDPNLVRDCLAQKTASVAIAEKIPHSNFRFRCRDFEKSLYAGDNTIEAPRFFEKSTFLRVGGYDSALYAAEDWDLAKRLKAADVLPSRSKYFLVHHENLSPISLIRKKFYYGQNLTYFRQKHKENPGKYIFRPAFLKNYKKAASNPTLFTGMVCIKLLEYAAITAGYAYSLLKR